MSGARRRHRIVFRCDASAAIGGGHAMRCLTLADALAEKGAQVTFVAAAMPDALAQRITRAGHALERIPASPEMQRDRAQWEEPPLGPDAQLADATAMEAAAGHADWLVVDHYLLDARWHSAARRFAGRILAIDDLANRPCDCDILLDQTFGRSAEDYRELAPDGAAILAGAAYALLRPEFARERPAALDRRQAGGPVRRILVSMGTADPGGVTAEIVEQALAAAPECAFDVVLGPQAASLGPVRALAARNPRVSVHVNSDRMAELMRDADLAIGAAGTTSWERCCLGLPAIVLVLAENQRLAAANLERAGAIALADSPEAISPLVQQLSGEAARLPMIAAAAAITDGEGAKLAAELMIGGANARDEGLKLRAAQPGDSRIAWLWRNDHATRRFSQTTTPITWPRHEAWWRNALGSSDRQLLIAEVADAPVAVVRFDRIADGEFEVSINLAPSARGSGLGARILAEACGKFVQDHAPVRLSATIHHDNPPSRRIFEKLGFVRSGALSNPQFEGYVLIEGQVA